MYSRPWAPDGIERRWDAETGLPRGIPVAHEHSVTTDRDRARTAGSLLKVIRAPSGATIRDSSGTGRVARSDRHSRCLPCHEGTTNWIRMARRSWSGLSGPVARTPGDRSLSLPKHDDRPEITRRRFSRDGKRGFDGRARWKSPYLGRSDPSAARSGLPGSPIDPGPQPRW